MVAQNAVLSSYLIANYDTPRVHNFTNFNRNISQNLNDLSQFQKAGFKKSETKEFDTVSIASSTHFTVVNGMSRFDNDKSKISPLRKILCNKSHQITILILTMSLIFLMGILLAIYLLESKCFYYPI